MEGVKFMNYYCFIEPGERFKVCSCGSPAAWERQQDETAFCEFHIKKELKAPPE